MSSLKHKVVLEKQVLYTTFATNISSGTYSVGLLQRIHCDKKELQALVLVPTRELAQQVQLVIQAMGDYLDVISHSFIGGNRVADDLHVLKTGVHVAVGTPGRIWDLSRRGAINLKTLKVLIFDEADEVRNYKLFLIIL